MLISNIIKSIDVTSKSKGLRTLHKQKFIFPTISEKLKYDENGRCMNAFEIITDPETLRVAYELIKSKPGNMVRGTDNTTLDGINEE
jgi:hypothetical protein